MAANVLQAPFNLVQNDYAYGNAFEATSPPSSPYSLYAVDSSPPSSPMNDMFELDTSDEELDANTDKRGGNVPMSPDTSPSGIRRSKAKDKDKLLVDLETSPAHPFSASTRAVKRPPAYSKDTTRPKIKRQKNEPESVWDVSEMPPHAGLHERDGYIQGLVPTIVAPTNNRNQLPDEEAEQNLVSPSHDPEHALWEETLAQAVDAVECKIDLSGQGLTHIPSKIGDLSKLVVIRDSNAPARELAPRRTCSKSTNSIAFGAGKLGHREDEIHLFLSRNNISSLPNELFNLDALVVLSLRANDLAEIPPLICQLRNLRELNVANNKLRYLPAEIMSLNLTSLAVDPNPFEENPYAKSEPSKGRWFGPIQRKHTILPFVEHVLRGLLAPSFELYGLQGLTPIASIARQQETVLEHCYDLPLQSEYVISPALRETLSACVPGSIASAQSPHAPPHTSPDTKPPNVSPGRRPYVSVCLSPRHLDISGGKYRKPVFVTHSEERLSWERHIAGQKVGGETGIPVRWRGCSAGCLEFLERDAVSNTSVKTEAEEDWSVVMDSEEKEESDSTPSVCFAPVQPPSRSDFKAFNSADIDLDD